MKKFLFILLSIITFIMFSGDVVARELTFDKVITIDDVVLYDVEKSSDGNYLVAGTYISGNNGGFFNLYLAKVDESGNILWKFINDVPFSLFYSVGITSDGNIMVVGSLSDPSYAGIFLFDQEGNIIWSKTEAGNTSNLRTQNSFFDNDSSVLVGYGGSTNSGFFMKIDKAGDKVFENFYNDESDVGLLSSRWMNAILLNDGNYLVFGESKYNDESYSCGEMVKYSNDGSFIKNKRYCENNKKVVFDRVIETKNYYYAIATIGVNDKYLLKFDINWNFLGKESYDTSFYIMKASYLDGFYLATGALMNKDNIYNAYVGTFDKYGKSTDYELYDDYANYAFNNYRIVSDNELILAGGYIITSSGTSSYKGVIAKYKLDYSIIKENTVNGSFDVVKEGNKGKITIMPNNGFELNKVMVRDSKNNVLVSTLNSDGNYYFDLVEDDMYVNVTYVSIPYNITKEKTENGKFEVVQENTRGKITVNPDEKFEVDKIVVKDSSGNIISTTKQGNDYYFDISSDVTVSVTFTWIKYNIYCADAINGSFVVEQVEDKGKIMVKPNEGYELALIEIDNGYDNYMLYYLGDDGNYYFDINDDVTVSVTFKTINTNKKGLFAIEHTSYSNYFPSLVSIYPDVLSKNFWTDGNITAVSKVDMEKMALEGKFQIQIIINDLEKDKEEIFILEDLFVLDLIVHKDYVYAIVGLIDHDIIALVKYDMSMEGINSSFLNGSFEVSDALYSKMYGLDYFKVVDDNIYLASMLTNNVTVVDLDLRNKKTYTSDDSEICEIMMDFCLTDFANEKIVGTFDEGRQIHYGVSNSHGFLKLVHNDESIFEKTFEKYMFIANAEMVGDYIIAIAALAEQEMDLLVFDLEGNLLQTIKDSQFYLELMAKDNGFYVSSIRYSNTCSETYVNSLCIETAVDYYSLQSKISVNMSNNGNISIDEYAKTGDEVKFTVEPKLGYIFKGLKVTDSEGNVTMVTGDSFIMPEGDVTIEAIFEVDNPNTGMFLSIGLLVIILYVMYMLILSKRLRIKKYV